MNNDDILIQRMESEEPVYIIERDDDEIPSGPTDTPNGNKWKKWLLIAIGVISLVALTYGAYKGRRLLKARELGITISVSPKDNINKLKQEPKQEEAKVVFTSDSVQGVHLDFYELHGLRASIEFEEPDLSDDSVYLYCRSADHMEDSTYLGTLVVNGEERRHTQSRLGYMAMVDDRMVIGVSPSDDVKDYVKENGGSFFRQFVLVSNGDVPPRFFLPGKYIRKAIGRKVDKNGDRLILISTRDEVTVRDFAYALREYGFSDAIYITGGPNYCYYRSVDGRLHDIGNIIDYPYKMWKDIIPWLVFRKR